MLSAAMVEIMLVDAGSNGSIIWKRCGCEDHAAIDRNIEHMAHFREPLTYPRFHCGIFKQPVWRSRDLRIPQGIKEGIEGGGSSIGCALEEVTEFWGFGNGSYLCNHIPDINANPLFRIFIESFARNVELGA
jgi:hypothetical protein